MSRITLALALTVFLATTMLAQNEPASRKTGDTPKANVAESSKPFEPAKPADYSREPFIVQQTTTKMRFENDGTGRQEVSACIKVQDESGVEQLGQLVWGYNSGNERMDVNYVRVRKADGSTVTAGADAVQDLSGPVSREAPMYTDYRQKHITVPGLRPGETLEYQYTLVLQTPLAAGQFWTEHNFWDKAIVLDEQLEIDVPAGRVLKLKTKPGLDPKIAEDNGRRLYRWASSHLTRDEDEDKPQGKKKKKKPQRDEDARPDVELSTFASWEEVGRWYAQLERERRGTTPDLQAKATALIAGRSTDLEKIEALYDYVAKNFRYVSLSFGTGRYQPHAASDVFANQYGDCKDKNTLLAALLSAAGFNSNSVLINTSRKIDPDVPSPAQFNHVITQVPLAKEEVWLDTTTEVAPFRMLAFQLRDKQALVVSQSGAPRLQQTPADPPVPNMQRMEAEGQVSELGKLTLHSKETMRGDLELGLRMIFRRLPETRWKDLLQMSANINGVQGEITDYKVSDPAATREPFQIEYTISQANYLDWTNKKSTLRLPIGEVMLQEFDDDTTEPLKLNVKTDSEQHLKLEFPPKFTVRAPLAVSVKRDYGEYSS
ncbi:MAG TPA: DUF3857 and transglutaminase domain-containing protein, partial [Terriglobales bacterium]|nr:DUF3857 and transglutaminase domain-containing protein [Terriglobales bacterium]